MDKMSFYENAYIPDKSFPIVIFSQPGKKRDEIIFRRHWHEQLELLFFVDGKASVECNENFIEAGKEDLIVINSNELHYGESLSDYLSYFCIIMDISLLQSSFFDACEAKYITPISQNLILFKNIIRNDINIINCVNNLIKEYNEKCIGFELAVKSCIYRLLVLLLRNHVDRILTPREYNSRIKNIEKLSTAIHYIEQNYNQEISIKQLSEMINLSTYHFCHVFKKTTGKTPIQYINCLRINKAEGLLKNTNMSVTEIALEIGFSDANYFSRLFKKYKKVSPSTIRKSHL
ncbi:MAG: helix-turn-helix transcriptional regulator [Firmicutes bacterium]|nr:helix-turn-helix transcriptional regulator [Bacillota bacterium]